jgi:nitrite reductase/ring-hydroxylating ferredoxin subunit
MAYHKVAKESDLPQGEMRQVEIGQEEILIANVTGTIYAVNNRCGHMNAPLSMGVLKGKIVECPLHKARYNIATGKCVRGPQMGGLEGVFIATTGAGRVTANIDTLDIKTYKTRVERGIIKVEIPEC